MGTTRNPFEEMKNVKLASGQEMPILGLGTWKLKGRQCEQITKIAIEMGYTHIDTAWMYENQREIGNVLREIRIERQNLFITTKIWHTHLKHADVLSQFDVCLKDLQTEYVDLLLIHWPSDTVPFEETFSAFQEIYDAGKVKSIGISNFSIDQVNLACKVSDLPICTNQVEYNIHNNKEELRKHCHEHKMPITAHRPLAVGNLAADTELAEIGNRHGKTAAQVALRWLIQKEIITIPKSGSAPHLRENLDIFEWQLTEAEMHSLE